MEERAGPVARSRKEEARGERVSASSSNRINSSGSNTNNKSSSRGPTAGGSNNNIRIREARTDAMEMKKEAMTRTTPRGGRREKESVTRTRAAGVGGVMGDSPLMRRGAALAPDVGASGNSQPGCPRLPCFPSAPLSFFKQHEVSI